MDNVYGNVIYRYTRKDALNDGVLVNVTDMAAEAGFKLPVAITASVSALISNIPEQCKNQDYNGRLWDVLWMAAYNGDKRKDSTLVYTLILPHEKTITTDKGDKQKFCRFAKLKLHIGPGDKGEPVITIMLPDED